MSGTRTPLQPTMVRDTHCSKCGRQPIGAYAPNPATTYLCAYCNEGARLRDEGVVVDRFGCVCHETCLHRVDTLQAARAALADAEPKEPH